ncbi:hypothetical protein SAMN05216285_0334 [Natrinema salifodinae]|uniref:Uncharacterized protein n=1 Tax=Natrinema salifodinae TaxID=1202768 RepID=A0A1I0M1Z6_9EURY|nr:hypothetical protein SAMN05216285_0334 [Natrinema salifodinae]
MRTLFGTDYSPKKAMTNCDDIDYAVYIKYRSVATGC